MSQLTKQVRLPYSENKRLHVINFFGGPCTYKSTTAAKLFAAMNESSLGYRTELLHESAKELKWDNMLHMFGEQDYIFANQNKQLRRLLYHDITHAIVDSSILLSLFYITPDFPQSFRQFTLDAFNTYTNINILMIRPEGVAYHQEGRNENFEEAIAKDQMIQEWFTQFQVPHLRVTAGQPDTLEKIIEYIVSNTTI